MKEGYYIGSDKKLLKRLRRTAWAFSILFLLSLGAAAAFYFFGSQILGWFYFG